jgi:hypothetical protein
MKVKKKDAQAESNKGEHVQFIYSTSQVTSYSVQATLRKYSLKFPTDVWMQKICWMDGWMDIRSGSLLACWLVLFVYLFVNKKKFSL